MTTMPGLQPQPATLVSAAAVDITLADAASLVAGAGVLGDRPVGMVWSATRFGFVAVDGGVLTGPTGPEPLGSVFEARVFGRGGELRWLHVAGGRGRAVVLAEQPVEGVPNLEAVAAAGWSELPPRRARATVEGLRYLLWGVVLGRPPGTASTTWSSLGSNRVGSLEVPIRATAGNRVALTVREYVAELGEAPGQDVHVAGNAVVVDERLMGIEERAPAAPGPTSKVEERG